MEQRYNIIFEGGKYRVYPHLTGEFRSYEMACNKANEYNSRKWALKSMFKSFKGVP